MDRETSKYYNYYINYKNMTDLKMDSNLVKINWPEKMFSSIFTHKNAQSFFTWYCSVFWWWNWYQLGVAKEGVKIELPLPELPKSAKRLRPKVVVGWEISVAVGDISLRNSRRLLKLYKKHKSTQCLWEKLKMKQQSVNSPCYVWCWDVNKKFLHV